ncbi:MAG: hypothetical protein L0H84_15205, partial [Pseudonocardia sp.]|nr:hypothetical protein [Pseudonocardia sp.]
MRFSAEDDEVAEFQEASDALTERFAEWTQRHGADADPADLPILLDWRYSYSDGVLDVWTCADVEEFLLRWCPRKLSADPEDVEDLPDSVAAWVDFLAHEGLLGPGSDPPARIRTFCAGIGSRFRTEMADPRNFGMAKSFFAGGVPDVEPVELPKTIGPVRMPRPEEIAETVRDGHALPLVRELARACPPPGRSLTKKGNLRLAEARELVALLDTGDDPEFGGYGTLRSAEELPVLSSMIRTAVAAGAVRRHDGHLVGVARFAKLDDIAAHAALVRAELAESLSGKNGDPFTNALAEATDHLLALLLDGPMDGVEAIVMIEQVLAGRLRMDPDLIQSIVPPTFSRICDILHGLDLLLLEMVQCEDCHDDHPQFELSAAGVPHAVERVRALGVDVELLPDPAEASATELVAGIMAAGAGFAADVRVWLAAQPDAAVAVDEFGAAIVGAQHEPAAVLLALTVVEELRLPGLPEAVHRHHTGAHEGLLIPWLVEHDQIDPETIEPRQLVSSIVDVAGAMIDLGSTEDATLAFPDADAL